MTDSLTDYFECYRPRFETHLQQIFADNRLPLQANPRLQPLLDALEYSSLNGGKRIRAMLVYMSAQCCGLDLSDKEATSPDTAAAAIELIHCYSLIHDDLPAMDDDALRRGRPTCHIEFGEANAILAGDALQALAFELLARESTQDPGQSLQLIQALARASGASGMVGGQAIDLAAVGSNVALEQLIEMHRLKTGALIECAIDLGAICANASSLQREALSRYACALGLAFQIQDDIIDIEGSPDITGKTQGADLAANKPTFPALLGLTGARDYALQICDEALAALKSLGPGAEPLRLLATYIISRKT
jgi:geranylgeranyl diphosphate synthase type II